MRGAAESAVLLKPEDDLAARKTWHQRRASVAIRDPVHLCSVDEGLHDRACWLANVARGAKEQPFDCRRIYVVHTHCIGESLRIDLWRCPKPKVLVIVQRNHQRPTRRMQLRMRIQNGHRYG